MKTFFLAALLSLGLAGTASAENFSRASGQASTAASGAVGQMVANGTALVGVSVGVPMMAVGALGEGIVTTSIGVIGKPLPVSDETIVRGLAPNKAPGKDEGVR